MNQSHNSSTPKIVGGTAIALIVAVAMYVLVINNQPESTTANTTNTVSTDVNSQTGVGSSASSTSSTASNTSSTSSSSGTSTYKDGTYKATVTYSVPHGNRNSITASVTIKNGVITDVSTDNSASDRESEMYISSFESSVSKAVVGKKIDASFSYRIGGASLTSSAFLDALDSIANKAKA